MFEDRAEAGKKLADELKLKKYQGESVVIYALPRGGVVLGYEIARVLGAPLDLVIPRKIGHPFNPEYAICAVAESGELICDEREKAAADPKWLEAEVNREKAEAKRRREAYFRDVQLDIDSLYGKTAIIVDDGVATGLTIRAAIRDIKRKNPKRLVVAVPVVPKDTAAALFREADELVALEIPDRYAGAVGAYYRDFKQVEDAEVIRLLRAVDK